ncbi:uncharacterized protein LOC121517935 [Cheilinus undulatus]|uniref:uncharacterized protein LOC121517935 n=1 Tax=Cheilinus undulatus TaxID=241271 RepID=UPI001BD5E9A4|nr:uncharacterized protein LOC121517935 [Cheilinus undulatus]
MAVCIKMKALFLISLFRASLLLQCDKKQITAHYGGDFIISCTYETNRYLFSKKYWCQGESRDTCEIILDSEGRAKSTITHRSRIVDAGRRGLFVKVTNLQFGDTGVYWVGIDKVYADIMTSVKVTVTDVPVSKPRLWPLSPLESRPTCWGQQVMVRCGSDQGTSIHYTWYYEQNLLHHSSDLKLHCEGLKRDNIDYYCITSNDVSSQRSETLSVQVLIPADSDCIYVIKMQGQPVYDCADRMTTTTISTTILTTTPAAASSNMKIHTEATNQSLIFLQTEPFFCRTLMGFPMWYTLLRWIIFASLLIFLCTFLICTNSRQKHARRRRKRQAQFRRLAR